MKLEVPVYDSEKQLLGFAKAVCNDRERPEVAVLNGVLLGYENCCIKYYMETRHFGLPWDKAAQKKINTIEMVDPHVLCPHCAEKL